MGSEKVIARVTLGDRAAISVCEGIKFALKQAGLPEDTDIPFHLSTGEEIRALEVVAEYVSDVATIYTMIARVD